MYIFLTGSLHKTANIKEHISQYSCIRNISVLCSGFFCSFLLYPDVRKYLCLWLSGFNYFYESDLGSNIFFSHLLILKEW